MTLTLCQSHSGIKQLKQPCFSSGSYLTRLTFCVIVRNTDLAYNAIFHTGGYLKVVINVFFDSTRDAVLAFFQLQCQWNTCFKLCIAEITTELLHLSWAWWHWPYSRSRGHWKSCKLYFLSTCMLLLDLVQTLYGHYVSPTRSHLVSFSWLSPVFKEWSDTFLDFSKKSGLSFFSETVGVRFWDMRSDKFHWDFHFPTSFDDFGQFLCNSDRFIKMKTIDVCSWQVSILTEFEPSYKMYDFYISWRNHRQKECLE